MNTALIRTSQLPPSDMRKLVTVRNKMGWNPTTVENLPTRLMCVMAELDELTQALYESEDLPDTPDPTDNVSQEMADVAMYLATMLHDLRPDYPARRVGRWDGPTVHQDPLRLVDTVRRYIVKSFEFWRRSNLTDAVTSLELAMLETCRLSASLGVPLLVAVRYKTSVLKTRTKRNGGKHPDS